MANFAALPSAPLNAPLTSRRMLPPLGAPSLKGNARFSLCLFVTNCASCSVNCPEIAVCLSHGNTKRSCCLRRTISERNRERSGRGSNGTGDGTSRCKNDRRFPFRSYDVCFGPICQFAKTLQIFFKKATEKCLSIHVNCGVLIRHILCDVSSKK